MRRAFRFPAPLYPIVDVGDEADAAVVGRARSMLAAGAGLLQLRAKHVTTRRFVDLARAVGEVCRSAGARFIVNDRCDIALVVGADGVHLGQDDLPATAARRLLGPERIIGVSTHNVDQAIAAAATGEADYLGIGPIYPTSSKANPDPVIGLAGLEAVRRQVRVPLVAIGGIDAERAVAVRQAGADAVAMIGALSADGDVEAATRRVLQALGAL